MTPMQKLFAPLALALLLISACTTVPGPDEGPEKKDVDRAEGLFEQRQFLEAAQAFNDIARSLDVSQRRDVLLRQAAALARAEKITQARQILRSVETEPAAPDDFMLRLTRAYIALAERNADAALTLLDEPPSQNIAPRYIAEYHLLRADAFTLQDHRLETARELVARETYIAAPALQQENQTAIWTALASMTERALRQLRVAPPPDTLSGWMELVELSKTYQLRPALLKDEIDLWRRRYPDHPISEMLLEGLTERRQEDVTYPDNIALLLPFSGRFGRAAQAVRDGFLAAYYTRSPDKKQRIRIYDTSGNTESIFTVYRRALDDGAQFVVGPLEKDTLDLLASQTELDVPTLALNYTNLENATPNLYQFGLAPEDEARQVAERTWLDGHVNGVALIPAGPWGQRVFKAFEQRWSELGGQTLEYQSYNPGDNDFSVPIRSLMNIDDSRRRYRQLRTVLKRSVKFSPRRRQDIDFVFVAAYPRQARQIRPQLKFFHASSLPVYTTSHAYTGNLNRERDRDMDGMIFGDMPWVLEESRSHSGLRAEVDTQITPAGKSLQRLYALGIDSFNIIAALNTLRRYPYERYDGETGSLSLDEKNRVHRQLTWVYFRSGQPTVISESD